ncbi:recombinase family protein [Priestia megaterium]|uniref:recombinase family protein n=1 Tax=Priestia megaterium TaxID=1404 RepID=UPI003458D26F
MNKREEYMLLYAEFDAKLPKVCGNCGSTSDLQMHHIVPLINGGNNILSNITRLCTDCHSATHGGHNFVKLARIGSRNNAKSGKRAGGSITYGYDSKNAEIYINEAEADVVRIIYKLRYVYECSITEMPIILNELAIPTKRNAAKWSHQAVKKILVNPMYFGEYVYEGVNYGKLIAPILDDEMKRTVDAFNEKYEGKRVTHKQRVFIDGEAV